jgi:hypothetical protein
VRAAIASQELAPERLESHRKLERELRALALRDDARGRLEERRRWKIITRAGRERGQAKRGG